MREFKFRGWNRIVGRMSEPVLIDKFPKDTQWQNLEILQFTGLVDRNGKEIYEGDISQDDEGCYWVAWDGVNAKWAISTTEHPLCDSLDMWMGDFEVIGNIYENPELLTL